MDTRLRILLCLLLLAFGGALRAQSIDSLSLRDTDSNLVRISTFAPKKALVLIFTGNHCVYSKKYEDRLIHIANEFQPKEIAFLMVNSNDPELSQDDRFELMRARAKEKSYPCPYVQDTDGKLAALLGATKNPEVFVVRNGEKGWEILYSGKIDDNPLIEERVERKFLTEALMRIVSGNYSHAVPMPAVGCTIKTQ